MSACSTFLEASSWANSKTISLLLSAFSTIGLHPVVQLFLEGPLVSVKSEAYCMQLASKAECSQSLTLSLRARCSWKSHSTVPYWDQCDT